MYRLFRGGNRKKLMKYLLIFFLGVVSLGMVLTLAPIPGGNPTTGQADVLASLNGANITVEDLQRALSPQLQNSSNDPRTIARLAQSTLNEMILRQALLTQAGKMGLDVSDQELIAALHQIPYLYQNGQFIGMAAYENLIQEESGMTVPQFEGQLRESILIRKLREAVTDDIQVTPEEVHDAFLRHNEKAKIAYVLFDPSQLVSAVQVTPQALNAYFAANRTKYKVPEERRVKYVLITRDAVKSQVNITPADLEQYYNSHISDYRVPERVKVAHILFKTTGETPQQKAATLTKAEKVLAQIRAGANFADMAKKYSDDTSASQGGELGWIQRGQTVKAFENTAFSLKPGQISGIVKTEYGYHIIKVEAHQMAHVKSFDEVKDSIQAKLEKQDVQAAQQALANKVEQEAAGHPNEFDAVARQNGLEAQETPLFAYNQAVADLGNNQSFENLAFELSLNRVGQPITVPKGVAVIQVSQIVPEHLPALKEVQDRVEQDYRTAQSKILAEQKAKAFAAQCKSGGFSKIAKSFGLTVKQSQDFGRQDEVDNLIPGTALASAFTLQPGQTSHAVPSGWLYVVFKVLSHTPANEADFAAQKDQIADQLLEQKRDLAFEIYREDLKQALLRSGQLKINEAAFKQFLGGYQETS